MQSTKSKTLLSLAIGVPRHVLAEEETVRFSSSAEEDTERHSILVLAVEHAFGGGRDRIIYETDVTPGACGYSECAAGIIKPVGSGLSAVLGFATARDRLRQKHCVVLVAHAATSGSILQQLEQQGVDGLARCVFIAPGSPEELSDEGSEPAPRFVERGGHVLNLTSAGNLLELASGLRRASNLPAPCLVLIDPAIAPEWQTQGAPPTAGTTPVLKESIAERVLQSSVFLELARFTRIDQGATPVLFSSARTWERKLLDEFGARALLLSDQDVREALPWCGALAQGGCQPIIVLNSDQFAAHLASLRSRIFALPQRVTVIVLDTVTHSVNALESVLSPILADVPLVLPGTPDEVLPLTKAALRAEGPRLLYLPIASRTFTAERDRWLDFRAAAGLRERAGQESGCGALPLMLGTPERESRRIHGLQLTPEMERWARECEGVDGGDPAEWRRMCHAIQLLELPSVDPGWRRHNRDTKFLAAMFHRLLDQVTADPDGDGLLEQLLRLPQGERPEVPGTDPHAPYVALTSSVWDEIWRRSEGCPRYPEFAELLVYDFRQLCNTVEYSDLVMRQPEMTNAVEHAMYSPQGMLVTCAATLDLMCSPNFDMDELGRLREAVWHAACMARYGDLTSLRRDGAPASAGLESESLNQWQIHRACLLSLRERVSSCCLRSYVDGLGRLLASQRSIGPTNNRAGQRLLKRQ